MSAAASPAVTVPARLHLDFLDGLRALAALYVVASHIYLMIFGLEARMTWPLTLANTMLYGHLAVSVFIVISGFCLTLPVVHSRQLKRGARDFYWRRARRILPPYYAALALTLALTYSNLPTGVEKPVAPSDFLVSLFLLQDLVPGAKLINLPLWSVAVEFHIYLFFPLLLWVWRRLGLAALLIAATATGAVATLAWPHVYPGKFWIFSCPWFIALFAFGMAAAVCSQSSLWARARSWMPPLALVAALVWAFLLWRNPLQPTGYQEDFTWVLPYVDGALGLTVAALLTMLAAPQTQLGAFTSRFKRALQWRPLVWVGTFAYSLYLTHYALMSSVFDLFRKVPLINDSRALQIVTMIGVGIPVLLGLAHVFFRLFERPFLSQRAQAAFAAESAPDKSV